MQTENLNSDSNPQSEDVSAESNQSQQQQEYIAEKDAVTELQKATARIQELENEKNRLVNFNETLKQENKEDRAKLRDVDMNELELFRQFREKAKEDKIAQLVSEGRTDEARRILAEDQAAAFEQKERDYSDRVLAMQNRADELESQLNEQIETNITMRKRQYFDGLVRDDDSFHQQHFETFVQVHRDRLEIADDGKFYALKPEGGRMLDQKGEYVTFENYYLSEKAKPGGLFWKPGTGTGVVASNGISFDKPYTSMSREEKAEFRKTFKSETAFMQELQRQRNAAKK